MAYFLYGFTTPSEVYRKSARTPALRYTTLTITSDGVCAWHFSTLNKDQTAWEEETGKESLLLPEDLLQKIQALVEKNYPALKEYATAHPISKEGGRLRRSLVRCLDLDFLVPDYILEYHDYCYLSRYIDFPDQSVTPIYVLIREIMLALSSYLFRQEKHPSYIYHAPAPKKGK
jgi:hypothetical protein